MIRGHDARDFGTYNTWKLEPGQRRRDVRLDKDFERELIRIVVIDGQNVFRERIRNILRGESGLRILGTARYFPRGIELIHRLPPHIALLGWRGHLGYTGEALAIIRDFAARTRVIVLAGSSLEKSL